MTAASTQVAPALSAVAAVAARHPGLKVEEAGDASLNREVGNVTGQDFRKAEVTSVPVTLLLLLLVFGALVAAGIPLLLAGTAVISAISLLAIPGHWLPIGGTTSSIVLLVGMAVGIDYSLFYLRRVREERAQGHTTRAALHTAARTSGRAIAGLRADRDDLAGRAVPDRVRRVLRRGDRHDHGRRHRDARLADVPAGAAVAAREGHRPGAHPVPGQAAGGRPGVPAVARGRHRGGAPPAGLGRADRRGPGRARHARCWACTCRTPASTTCPPASRWCAASLDIQQAFPGGPAPAAGRRDRQRPGRAGGAGRRHGAARVEVAATHGAIREPITTVLFGPPGPAPGARRLGPAGRGIGHRPGLHDRPDRAARPCAARDPREGARASATRLAG